MTGRAVVIEVFKMVFMIKGDVSGILGRNHKYLPEIG